MTTGQHPHLRLVTDDLVEQAAQNRMEDELLVDEAVRNNDPELVQVPEGDFEEALAQEAATGKLANEPVDPSQRQDVLGLIAAAVWMVADEAKVSRGKVRRVLKAFEPLFWTRLSEAYDAGEATGYYQAQIDMHNAMENAEENSEAAAKQLILPVGVDVSEHADDPSGTEGREEGLPPEA